MGRGGSAAYAGPVTSNGGPAAVAQPGSSRSGKSGSRSPAKPRIPAVLDQVSGSIARLQADGRYQNVHVLGAEFSRVIAAQVEVVATRLERVDLAGAQLPGVVVRDVAVDRGDWSNVVAYQAHLTRSTLHGVRMTGAQIGRASCRERVLRLV